MPRVRARTDNIEKTSVDFLVEEFTCKDSATLKSLGLNAKASTWKVRVYGQDEPVVIEVQVDRGVQEVARGTYEVSVSIDGSQCFPPKSDKAQDKLQEDFKYERKFRGTIIGLNQKGKFEMQMARNPEAPWVPVTLTQQDRCGNFEVTASIAATGNDAVYPNVNAARLRYVGTGEPVVLPERMLTLTVPKDDALHAVLAIDGCSMTHFFGRVSPKIVPGFFTSGSLPTVHASVNKKRDWIDIDVGHSILDHFITGEVRSVSSESKRLRKAWTIMLGPMAAHTVSIEREYHYTHTTDVVTLKVDDELLVECAPEDLDIETDSLWECTFRFMGEKCFEFEVFETNDKGVTMDTQGKVPRMCRYQHDCRLSLPQVKNFNTAELYVDGVEFRDMPVYNEPHPEPLLSLSTIAFDSTYRMMIPYKMYEPEAGSSSWRGSVPNLFGRIF